MIVKLQNFDQLIDNVYQTHCQLQLNAKKVVNLNLTIRNWLVGCYIVEFEQNGEDRAKYGNRLHKGIMNKIRVFISSVQKEFTKERQMLFDYLMSDPLLGLFFHPFVFERIPAVDHSVQNVYLKEVAQCDIYLGLLGRSYGYEDEEEIGNRYG